MRSKLKTVGITVCLIGVSLYLLYSYINSGKDNFVKNDDEMYEDTKESAEEVSKSQNQIVVEIKGAIKNPNVYWLSEDSIVEDVIDKAGGLSENADIETINRAEKLKNHQLITIPDKNNSEKCNVNVNILGKEKGNLSSNLININTSDEKELDSLPGIGPAKAKDIISYREENGGFQSIEDIKNVKGIGENLFEKIKDRIIV